MPWGDQGSTRRWRKLRQRVLERDSPDGIATHAICQLQIKNICTRHATTAHHTQPWTGNPADTHPNHLIAACNPCNVHAGEPTNPDPEPKPWPT